MIASKIKGPEQYADHARAVAELGTLAVDRLRSELCRLDGRWEADYVWLRFAARKPS